MTIIKRIGLSSTLYILALLLIPGAGFFFYKNGDISLTSYILITIGCLSFIILNIIDGKKKILRQEKKSMEKCEEYIKKREWKNAIELFDKILLQNPTNYKAMMGKGYCYRETLEYDKAIAEYKKVVALQSDYAEAHFLLGLCYFRERAMKEAFESFERTLALNPDFMEAYLFLGDAHRFKGDKSRAKEYYEKYLAKCNDEKVRSVVLEKIESLESSETTDKKESISEVRPELKESQTQALADREKEEIVKSEEEVIGADSTSTPKEVPMAEEIPQTADQNIKSLEITPKTSDEKLAESDVSSGENTPSHIERERKVIPLEVHKGLSKEESPSVDKSPEHKTPSLLDGKVIPFEIQKSEKTKQSSLGAESDELNKGETPEDESHEHDEILSAMMKKLEFINDLKENKGEDKNS